MLIPFINGMAPFSPHFDSQIPDYDKTAQVSWDFGDPGSLYNQVNGGFNCAHRYEKPGTYTVTLTKTVNGTTSTESTQVFVAPDTRTNIYWSTSGDDSNNGLSELTPVKSIAKANSLLGDNKKLLLKRGDTFLLGNNEFIKIFNTANISYQNVVIDAYGTGPNPILKSSSTIETYIINTRNSYQLSIQNIEFDSTYTSIGVNSPKIPVFGMCVGGKQTTVFNCVSRNLCYFMNLYTGSVGTLVLNNSQPNPFELRAYFVWTEGTYHSFLGNTITGTTIEHPLRGKPSHTFVYGNTVTAVNGKTCMRWMYGNHIWVQNNTCIDGIMEFGPLMAGAGTQESERTYFARCENNLLKTKTQANTDIQINHGLISSAFRNNLIDFSSGVGSFGIRIPSWYNVAPAQPIINRYADDCLIENNTVITMKSTGGLLSGGGWAAGANLYDAMPVANNGLSVNNNLTIANGITAGYDGAGIDINYGTGQPTDMIKSFSNNIFSMPTNVLAKYAIFLHPHGVTFSNSPTCMVTPTNVNKLPNCSNNQFVSNVTLPVGSYTYSTGSVTAGATGIIGAV